MSDETTLTVGARVRVVNRALAEYGSYGIVKSLDAHGAAWVRLDGFQAFQSLAFAASDLFVLKFARLTSGSRPSEPSPALATGPVASSKTEPAPCRRETGTQHMPIFDISPSRTGRESLTTAIRMLGFRACYGCPEKYQADMLAKLLQDRVDFMLIDDFDAVCNLLSFAYYRLAKDYPTAKFILLEDSEATWVEAVQSQMARNDQSKLTRIGTVTLMHYGRLMNIGCMHTDDTELLARKYRQRCAEIRDFFAEQPAGRLLVMNLTDGWEPLCKFLDRKVPHAPFPKLDAVSQ